MNGNDTVYIADTLKNTFHIETGPGNDTVVTSSGKSTVLTGTGDDMVMTRGGASYVDTGDGNDIVNANGTGTTVAYTGKGADFFRGGAGMAFIDAGEGDDVAVGGQGHSILCGGDGDDLITAGAGSNVIYTGQGQDILNQIKDRDKVFTDSEPTYIAEGRITPHKKVANTFIGSPIPLPESGLIIQGSEEFIVRVQDDLKLLLSSGNGSQLLRELTKSIRKSQKPITIAELKQVNNGLYIPNLGDGRSFIQVGMAGLPDFGGTVYYNPAFSTPGAIPLTSLYHELCHAYNFVTGTRFLGASPDGHQGTKQAALVKNDELQAVGLPCNTEPFDFDKDPATPALPTNPAQFSENGIREELGLPLRKTYIHYSDD
ncbi:M91 family zinc metallopeptidase [Pseudomonas fragi]|uniref:M91 family zinc metallopeptidase n=1 Tax=Pseudomonas fragi TaxID=296 RepID=UPI0015CE75AB|nr:M91 family zinc metallopeptidase [Pseudomonas fragi]